VPAVRVTGQEPGRRDGAAQRRVRESLREQVLRGDLAPGQGLVEADLAEQFEVTRAGVRAALIDLTAEGLVERIQHRGARVRVVTLDEAIEITECRMVLEGLCAAKAAERASGADIADLEGLGARMRRAVAGGDLMGYLGLGGHELVQQCGEELGLLHQTARLDPVAAARQISLVAQQVDDSQDVGEAGAEVVGGGDPVRDAGLGDLAFGAGDALADGGLRHEEGFGDLRGGQPADHAQGEGDLGGAGQGGVAAGEDEPEPAVGLRFGRSGHEGAFLPVAAFPAEYVEAAAAGDGVEPRVGPVRDALGGTVGEGGLDGVCRANTRAWAVSWSFV
jgi:hypothetical protein